MTSPRSPRSALGRLPALAVLLIAGCTPAEGAPAGDLGDFRVVYDPPHAPAYREWQADLRRIHVLEDVAEALNETFILPADVRLSFAECGEPNAFYDPEPRRIRICFELMDELYGVFGEEMESEEELNEAAWGAIYFTLYHELGHALVDLWDLPITGREEDAVDQLAAFLLADGTAQGETAALNGANAFLLEDAREEGEIDRSALWSEHSLDSQRFYNIICWVYGTDTRAYGYLVEDGTLPPERAEQCEYEYERLDRSWSNLLAPYLKR